MENFINSIPNQDRPGQCHSLNSWGCLTQKEQLSTLNLMARVCRAKFNIEMKEILKFTETVLEGK